MGPCPPAGPSSVACDRARELLSPPVINGTVHSERLAWFTATADDWHGSQRATTRVSGHSVCPLTWVSNPGAIVISGCDRSQAQTWQCCALACPQHHGCKGRRAHLGLVGGVQPATCTHSRHPSASPFGSPGGSQVQISWLGQFFPETAARRRLLERCHPLCTHLPTRAVTRGQPSISGAVRAGD